jgi:nifR3 family TIM-barrel protein
MPQVAQDIVAAIRKQARVPVTVKMRAGISAERVVAVPFAQCMEAAGASLIAVHGRTREQYYSGKADWDIIGAVKSAVRIPVIGNGDIWKPEDAGAMLSRTGCDGVMIARGALGNPWLLKRTIQYVRGDPVDPPPSPRDKIRGALEHLELMALYKNEAQAVVEMRKHLAWYLKGLRHTASLKAALFQCRQKGEVYTLLNAWTREYLDPDSAGMGGT